MANEPRSVVEQPSDGGGFFGHPRGLSTLFFTEMWERFSYYGIRPLLILYMTAALASGGFGFDRTTASAIVGIYAASVYLASLPGGWIADRILGLQRAIWWGGVLIALGHLAIGLSAVFARSSFFLGLMLIALGTGLLKPNISAIVGDLYPDGGAKRDAGFSLFYMGINIGAFTAPLITGVLGERVGWHWGFGAAGVGMVLGLIVFRMRATTTLRGIGTTPSSSDDERRAAVLKLVVGITVLVALVVLASTGIIPVDAVWVASRMSYVMLALALLYFAYMFLGAELTGDERKRVVVVVVLFLFSTIFWSAFEQAPTSLNLFAADYTDRRIFGWEMPTLWLQAANSFFVIALAPVFAKIWTSMDRQGRDPSRPAKFAFALFVTAIGFLIMVFAANRVIDSGGGRVSPWWLVASYLFQTIGELSLSPVGLAAMTALAPRRFAGQMMGIWFISIAIGNLIAGLVGGEVDPNRLDQMPQLFVRTTISLVIASIACGLLVVPIRRMLARTEEGTKTAR